MRDSHGGWRLKPRLWAFSEGRKACLRRLQRQRARLFWEAAKAALAA
jgi:hypothetical protein